jgi:NADH:ubiquinone oxidoreductase subunit H
LTGYFSRNKYALLAALRAGLLVLNLELFLGLMVLNLATLAESFCLSVFVIYQEFF